MTVCFLLTRRGAWALAFVALVNGRGRFFLRAGMDRML
jgi:hypothetical protein